jgi:hypothetical protein
MISNISHGLWASCIIGGETLIGVAEGNWFNTIERLNEGKRDLFIGEDAITLLGIELSSTDVSTLIEMALMMNDEQWFNEITSKYILTI